MMSFPDVECPERSQLLLLGQSGSGKTTLLHLLCGMLQPTAGEISIQGQNLVTMTERERDAFRGRHFGIVFQKSHFVQSCVVVSFLALLGASGDLTSQNVEDRGLHG